MCVVNAEGGACISFWAQTKKSMVLFQNCAFQVELMTHLFARKWVLKVWR